MNQRFGMLREIECDFIETLVKRIHNEFGSIRFLEVGVCGAGTIRGLYRHCAEHSIPFHGEGVDFEHYRPNPIPADDYVFHSGDSMDAWRTINGTFNFLLVDGCHCVNHALCDFSNYSPLVVTGGYVVHHDTALPTALGKDKQEEWPQTDHSYAGKPPSVLGVREALTKLGLLQGYRTDWKLIEEVPSDTGLMGVILFQKTKEL